jgi:DNA-binding response OmpR family regulator
MEMVTILVIGRELGNQLAQCMAAEKAKVLRVEKVDKVRVDGKVRAVVLDASVVPIDLETLRSLREQVKVPLLAVVSTYEEARLALHLGCAEVVVRPFDLEELKLRAHKVLGGGDVFLVGALLIDLRARRVRRRGEDLHLTSLEFDLLAYLARNAGRVVGYDELLERVWGYECDEGNHDLIRSCLKRLRKKIEDEPGKPRYIVTVRGVGCRLEP